MSILENILNLHPEIRIHFNDSIVCYKVVEVEVHFQTFNLENVSMKKQSYFGIRDKRLFYCINDVILLKHLYTLAKKIKYSVVSVCFILHVISKKPILYQKKYSFFLVIYLSCIYWLINCHFTGMKLPQLLIK